MRLDCNVYEFYAFQQEPLRSSNERIATSRELLMVIIILYYYADALKFYERFFWAFTTSLVCGRYAANIYTYYYYYSITPHSFIPGLEPSFSANPSHRYLSFLLPD